MKKNVMMRVASVMLVLVLLTSSVISGTFAKYVTSGTSQDTARVAHWGVEITGTADIFSDKYNKDEALYSLSAESVVSNNGENVVAPGTKGTIADITLKGTPEVAARIEHKVSKIEFKDWLVDTNTDGTPDTFYCPLSFTIGTKVINGADFFGNEAGLINEITGAVAARMDVAPNSNLAGSTAEDLVVSWSWPYYVSDLYDQYDTYLGDRAAGGYPSTVTISVTTTVTQID